MPGPYNQNQPDLSQFVPKTAMDDSVPMSTSHTSFPTSYATRTVETALAAQIAGKSDIGHTHAVADVTGLQAFLDDKASKDDNLKMYLAGVKKNQPKLSITTATVSGGTVVFNLTDDNLSTGNALFTNVYLDSVQAEAYGSSVFFGTPTLAGNKKTISFPVSQITTVLGLLSISTAANGISCRLMIMGD